MKPIARLVSRGTDKNDGLLIGVKLKGDSFFEPNTVYEILEMDGQHVIRKVGESIVANTMTGENWMESPVEKTWGDDVNTLLNLGPELFLSRDEHNSAFPPVDPEDR